MPYSPFEMNDLVTQMGPFKAVSPDAMTQNRAGSEISFHDTQGQEIAYFQAEKDANSLIKNAKTSVIGNSRACTVGTDDQLNIENSQQIDIGHDQTVTIGNDRSWTIGGDVVQKVKHNYTLLTNDSIVHATDGRIDYYAQGNILIHSDAQITLTVGKSFIKMTTDNITIQSGDRVDINPMQGSKEYKEQKAAKDKADAQAAAQQKIANATGAEKDVYDKAKAFQDNRGAPGTSDRWKAFHDAAEQAGMGDSAWKTYSTANNIDLHTGKPLP
jgi:type VI secretion system secreted protein VgrG